MTVPGRNYAAPSSDTPQMSSPNPPPYSTYIPGPPQAASAQPAPSLRDLLAAEPPRNATRSHSALNATELLSAEESQKRNYDEALRLSTDTGNKRLKHGGSRTPQKQDMMPQPARGLAPRRTQILPGSSPSRSYTQPKASASFGYPHLPGAEQYRQQQFGPGHRPMVNGSSVSSYPREETYPQPRASTSISNARGTQDDPVDLDAMPDFHSSPTHAAFHSRNPQGSTGLQHVASTSGERVSSSNALGQREGLSPRKTKHKIPDAWVGRVPDRWTGPVPNKYYLVNFFGMFRVLKDFEEALEITQRHQTAFCITVRTQRDAAEAQRVYHESVGAKIEGNTSYHTVSDASPATTIVSRSDPRPMRAAPMIGDPPTQPMKRDDELCTIRQGWEGKVAAPDGWYGMIPDRYYVVRNGRNPGLYTTFEEALDATMGHPGPTVYACSSMEDVSAWMYVAPRERKIKPSNSAEYRIHKSFPSQTAQETRPFQVPPELLERKPYKSVLGSPTLRAQTMEHYQASLPKAAEYPSSPPPSYTATVQTAPADIVPIVEPELCPEQARLVEVILSGRNVFYTGSAGCGKSTVLKAFVKQFNERGKKVNIVAPTGRAALDINGSTTWTYAGWTPDHHKRPLNDLRKAAHGKFVSARMKETDVLVIDEISMVENLHLERLNAVMKEARRCPDAFGGVQIIVTGDFCQLPPVKPFKHCIQCGGELIVKKEGEEYKCRSHGMYYDKDKWAFRSRAWEECDFVHVNLTTIHRQSDKVFIDILNKLRIGIALSMKERDLLLKHDHQTRNAIMLFPTRAEVKRVNDEMFNKLRSNPHPFFCLDRFSWNEDHAHLQGKHQKTIDGRSLVALSDHRFEPQIQLKKGMLVVLLHNLDLPAGLVNGSQGTIQGFEDYDPAKLPKSNAKGRERAGSEEPAGSGSLVGDYASFRERQIKDFINTQEFKKWPIVTFLNGVTRTIFADCTVNELGDKAPYSLLSRTQIPLMAAWAMTTHKSQGMTLNRVRVDLGRAFEEGQAYVALSRARSLEGLEVISLPPSAKMQGGNPQVKEFLHRHFNL